MFIVAPLTIAKICNQRRGSSTDEWITMKYYSLKRGIKSFIFKKMGRTEDIMSSEINQT
jgi:hypothetical protein